MVRVFQIVAVIFVVIAAYFLWTGGDKDYAFVASVFAVTAGFLSYRFRLKARIKRREDAEETLPE
jgi:Flp pilus assembly protein TadB